MLNPKKYAQNNIIGSLNILISCIDNGVKNFFFHHHAAKLMVTLGILIDEFAPITTF